MTDIGTPEIVTDAPLGEHLDREQRQIFALNIYLDGTITLAVAKFHHELELEVLNSAKEAVNQAIDIIHKEMEAK